MRNKKMAEMQWEEIMVLIIVIFVVAAVLIFIFKTDINNWLKNLPSFDNNIGDEEIDIGGQSDIEIEGICKGENIIGRGTNPIILNGEKTNLYLKFEDNNLVELFVSKRGFDTKIGEFQKFGEIKIYDEIINKGDLYNKLKTYLPEYIGLVNLNKAHYLQGNIICQEKLIKEDLK